MPAASHPLRGRVAIVTGGTSGLGRATCSRLAAAGANVVVVGRDPRRIRETREALPAVHGAAHHGLCADVCSAPALDRMAAQTMHWFGRIDILVASAGIMRPPGETFTPVATMSLADWNLVVDTNLKGTYLSIRAVLPHMIRQQQGEIVTISSKSGLRGLAFDAAYCSSKFGLIGLTESVAEEVADDGIRVQVVLPGTFDTPLWEQNPSTPRPPDLPPPDRVADLVLHLLALPPGVRLRAPLIEPREPPVAAAWDRP
jgi:NAD(P)-dependent dehydrogenase (short-subunit alcohol dehydrogenase family)